MDIRGRRSLVYNVCQYDEEKDITTVKIECACARVVLHRLERRTRIEWYPPGIESSTPFSNEFWDCDGFISLRFDRITSYNVCYTKLLRDVITEPYVLEPGN